MGAQGLHRENAAEPTKGFLGAAGITPGLTHCKDRRSRPPVRPGLGQVVAPVREPRLGWGESGTVGSHQWETLIGN